MIGTIPTGALPSAEISAVIHQALKLKRFDHGCTCGGYAHRMNGRPESNPHMDYCPQKPQYDEWYRAIHEEKRLAE